ncbi:MAG: hypothetical protein LBE83_04485, partial [Propionibacteriaceae bacterium]|nr:hypothetical protein [Propionibacteriaceae bacterium]
MRRFSVFATVFMLGLGLAGCSPQPVETPTPIDTAPTTVAPSVSLADILHDQISAFCVSQFDAALTTAEEFTHPTWGLAVVAGCLSDAGAFAAVAMDATGNVQWTKSSADVVWPSSTLPTLTKYQPASPVFDASGNLYIEYMQSSKPGVEVLRPTNSGFEVVAPSDIDWNALYNSGRWNEEGFWDIPLFAPAILDRVGADGFYRVRMVNDDKPHPTLVFVWTGEKYEMGRAPGQFLFIRGSASEIQIDIGPAKSSVVLITVSGSEVSLTYCGSQGISVLRTCTSGIDGGLTAGMLLGETGA